MLGCAGRSTAAERAHGPAAAWGAQPTIAPSCPQGQRLPLDDPCGALLSLGTQVHQHGTILPAGSWYEQRVGLPHTCATGPTAPGQRPPPISAPAQLAGLTSPFPAQDYEMKVQKAAQLEGIVRLCSREAAGLPAWLAGGAARRASQPWSCAGWRSTEW